MESFNIETAMDEIRDKILKDGIVADALHFEEVTMPDDLDIGDGEPKDNGERFHREMYYLRTSWKVPLDAPVQSHNKLIDTVKKTVRKLTNFQIFPLVAAQNELNASITKCLYDLNQILQAKDEEIKALNERVKVLEKMTNERGDAPS
jgi:hypothetical protein